MPGDLLSQKNGHGSQNYIRDPTASPTSSERLQALRAKWKKHMKRKEKLKNTIKKEKKKKRKTFQINSDSSQSEYSTDKDQDFTDWDSSSDNWSSDEYEATPDPKWDAFMTKLLAGHHSPKKKPTMQEACKLN